MRQSRDFSPGGTRAESLFYHIMMSEDLSLALTPHEHGQQSPLTTTKMTNTKRCKAIAVEMATTQEGGNCKIKISGKRNRGNTYSAAGAAGLGAAGGSTALGAVTTVAVDESRHFGDGGVKKLRLDI
jgi:hypothetical protein